MKLRLFTQTSWMLKEKNKTQSITNNQLTTQTFVFALMLDKDEGINDLLSLNQRGCCSFPVSLPIFGCFI